MLDGVLDLIPAARVGFVGLYRDEKTLKPVQYYYKVPSSLGERLVIALDPMLATGNSAVAAIDRKSTRLNSSHVVISYAVFCLKKKK